MTTVQQMYHINLDQIASLIKATGHKRTTLVQGHMGTGKSSLLNALGRDLPTHTACYFDCTTKDLGDLTIPNIMGATETEGGYVTYMTNEELGAHIGGPIILMVDELGKANPAVQQGLGRALLEHKIGSYTLHPDSIVFATTNMGAEGVGDVMKAHLLNRLTVVQSRKPTADEWVAWGINNNVHSTMLAWVKDNPQVLQSFEEVKNPEENPFIFHPQQQRRGFVTPRSLEAGSDWLHQRAQFDDTTLTALLMGTIGEQGAMSLMTHVKIGDQLPSLQSIKDDPMTAIVPTSASAVCMVVYRALSTMDRSWCDAWMDYLGRLDTEAQGLFANGVRAPKYSKQSVVMTNRKFTQWALANNYMFAADKK